MARLKIFTYPDAVLAKKAKPVARVDKSYFKTADDMLETMYYAPGIGLAANQVGLLERFIVVDTEYDSVDLEDGQTTLPPDAPQDAEVINGAIVSGKKPIVLINPEIIYTEGENAIKEGCLSVPDYSEEVLRHEKIKVRYQNLDGLEKILDAEDLLSICIQHEIDHLNGKLFIDHLSPLKQDFVKKKLIKDRKRNS